jgi:hypothetical protein
MGRPIKMELQYSGHQNTVTIPLQDQSGIRIVYLSPKGKWLGIQQPFEIWTFMFRFQMVYHSISGPVLNGKTSES